MPGRLSAFTSRLTPTPKRRRQPIDTTTVRSEPNSRSSTPVLEVEKKSESIMSGTMVSLPLLMAPIMTLASLPMAAAKFKDEQDEEEHVDDNKEGSGEGLDPDYGTEEDVQALTMPVPPPPRPASSCTLASASTQHSQPGDMATTVTDLCDDSSEDESAAEVPCLHDEHRGMLMLDEVYPINVNTLFEYLFSDTQFFAQMCTARRWTDVVFTPWEQGSDGCKQRTLSYTLPLNYAFLPKFAHNTEKQTWCSESRPGFVYTIKCMCTNQGVPYSDSFAVANHYCITRVSATDSRLRIHSEVVFRKHVWGFVKSFIEKNVIQGIKDGFDYLRGYMREHCVSPKMADVVLVSSSVAGGGARLRMRRRLPSSERRQWSQKKPSAVTTSVTPSRTPSRTSTPLHQPVQLPTEPSATNTALHLRISVDIVVRIVLAVLVAMLAVNALLYYKLSLLENVASTLKSSSASSRSSRRSSVLWPPPPGRGGSSGGTVSVEEWSRLLSEQQQAQKREMESWQRVIAMAVDAVTEAEQRLRQLHDDVMRHAALVAARSNVSSSSPTYTANNVRP